MSRTQPKCGVQALAAQHNEVRDSLQAVAVAKDSITRKLERNTSDVGDTISVRHHCTLSLSLSVPVSASVFGRFCQRVPSLVTFKALDLFLSMCLVRMCWLDQPPSGGIVLCHLIVRCKAGATHTVCF